MGCTVASEPAAIRYKGHSWEGRHWSPDGDEHILWPHPVSQTLQDSVCGGGGASVTE